jgi:CRISPR-associated protein Csb2
MTTTLVLSFPWGLFHATPWARDVNEAAVEWPPSPWRLLRGLYATWRWRAPEIEASTVEGLLAELAAPPSYLLPPHVEAHTRHYMPDMTHMKDRPKWRPDTKYSGDAVDKVFDPFVVLERGASALVRWPCDLAAEARSALALLATSLPYLGRAESICEARLAEPSEARGFELGAGEWLEPIPDGDSHSVVPGDIAAPPARVLAARRPLDLAALTVRTTTVRAGGFTLPPGSCWIAYRRPQPANPDPSPRRLTHRRPTAARWAFASAARPSVRAAVAMTDVLRQACLSRFGRRFDGEASCTLAGKDPSGAPLKGHRHAHYLALDADGDNLIDHLVVWAPEGLDAREVSALADLDRLTGFGHISDFRPGRLGLEALGEPTAVAPELVGPARVWRSATPFAPPHHAHKRTAWDEHVLEQVQEELKYRGLPAAQSVRIVQGDWLAYRRHRVRERLEDGRRVAGVEIRFDRDVAGPVLLGSLSHFGLGMFVPANG